MKVLALVGSCRDCPRRSYYSGGIYRCSEAQSDLPFNDADRIPVWCPLADYPAVEISRVESEAYGRGFRDATDHHKKVSP